MGNIKKIIVNSHTYYFFDDLINIKEFDSSLTKKTKNIGIYNTGYITIKKINDYENINSLNSLYLIIGKADRYIEENYRNKCLVFNSTVGNKKLLAKFTNFWEEIKHLTEENVKKVSMKMIS